MDNLFTLTPDDLEMRLRAFAVERFPFLAEQLLETLHGVLALSGELGIEDPETLGPGDLEALEIPLEDELRRRFGAIRPKVAEAETAPGVTAEQRWAQARAEVSDGLRGFLRREALRLSFTEQERLEMLRGMVVTRAVDNRLKNFFTGGEVRYTGKGPLGGLVEKSFQGKGFRSLGQEAIYAATLRLRRGEEFRTSAGAWNGDIVAPLIRDAGLALGMSPEPATVEMILSAQMGKAGPPMDGRDLHLGDLEHGILPPAAPLSIASLTAAGLAFAMDREGGGRVAISMIGEGGSSLGEWHEAINLSAARRLPIVFCIQNNQTALSTPVAQQSAVRTFADKAVGYGIPGLTLDGTDPEAIAAAFAWATERARAGKGPTLLELVAMRMCGHAHHDDMLYLGRDPRTGWTYPDLAPGGYADEEAYRFWAERDPIEVYGGVLEKAEILGPGELDSLKEEAEALVEEAAQRVLRASWPDPAEVGRGVYGDLPGPRPRETLADRLEPTWATSPALPPLDPGSPMGGGGRTFLEGILLAVRDALAGDPRAFVYGQDVGAPYGNAFLLLRPLLEDFEDRIVNSTLAEGGILGVCVGAALGGLRPIGEIQFNDFVATGFNQLVNNAAKVRYRWGGSVPMVVRMPWGGLRSAGPYHSQNTEAWFYRTPGLKLVAPSTPEDARALFAAAMRDPDPVLFFEHIALYRDPRIRQTLEEEAPEPLPLGRAALRRRGSDLAIISYGAYVHAATRVAERLARDGIEASVLDLRSLVPLDREAALALTRHCGRVLIVHEDTRTGGIGESLAAILQEEAFEFLDAPIRIVGALDTPVPYSPPLEAEFLPSEEQLEKAARLLVSY